MRFTPLALTGLISWYKQTATYCFSDAGGAVPCGDGDGIRVWKDANGGASLTQATAGARAVFHTGGIGANFDGSRYYGTWATGSPAGLFSFHQFNSITTGYHNIYDSTEFAIAAKAVMLWVDANARLEPDAEPGSWDGIDANITNGAWHTVFLWRSASVATRMWIDGIERTASGGTPGIGVRTIPANLDLFSRAGAVCFNGHVEEFGFGSALPSDTQLTQLQTYLAAQ